MSKKGVVAVVGLGYVGLPLALLCDEKEFETYGVDMDSSKIQSLKKSESYIDDVTNKQISKCTVNFTSGYDCIRKASIVIICVPTPVDNRKKPDLSIVKNAVTDVAKNISPGTLVIIESTINPGVCDELIAPLIESVSGFTLGSDVFLAHCPERINPGDKKWNVRNINRVVGANDLISLDRAVTFYESVVDADIKPMGNIKEAEAVKIVENSFRDVNIAFVNELAMSFHKLGINVVNVIDGAATKPFSFMAHYPSVGVGGHCIPVDPYYLIEYAHDRGFEHDFLSLARNINERMPDFTASLVDELSKEDRLHIKRVAVLGLSYKKNVADLRESPSIKLIDSLKKRGYEVVTYDPLIPELSSEKTLKKSLMNTDCVVLATAHDIFVRELTVDLLASFKVKGLIDGQNRLQNERQKLAQRKIVYRGIGIE